MKNHWFTRRLATVWFTLVVIVISLIVREYFPLSRFPMYAFLDSKTHYLFLTDENGEPVTDMRHQFMQTSIRMQKMHNSKINKLLEEPGGRERDSLDLMREAGPSVLDQMIEFQRARWAKRKDHSDKRTFQRLDLWVVLMNYSDEPDSDGNRLQSKTHHLATWPPEVVGTPPPIAEGLAPAADHSGNSEPEGGAR